MTKPIQKTSQQPIGAKKKYASSLASGVTTALEQKDLEKALIKGKLRGRSDIEIIAKSAEKYEQDHQAQLVPATQQFSTLSNRQQKRLNDKRQEISQEIFDYHLEHIKYSFFSKSILAIKSQTTLSQTSAQTATQSPLLPLSQKPKILLHYHQDDEVELADFITQFKIDLGKIGITSEQIIVISELTTELTASNINQFQQVISLVGSNFKSSLTKSSSNKNLLDEKLEQELELFEKQSVTNLPVLALGEYTSDLGRGFRGKLILDLTQKYQDAIFNNNYQENFFSLAKTIYNIDEKTTENKDVNDFFAQQRISYYQKQKYLLDNKSDARLDKIIAENRYGLQTILQEIEEEIHQESRQAIDSAKIGDYKKLSAILNEKNINITEKEADGNTILHHLVKNPNDKEAQKLINKILDDYPNLDVNDRPNNNDSFIHIIAKNLTDIRDLELQKIIKRFVNKGLRSHHKNLENKSALEIFRARYEIFSPEDQIFNEINNPDLYTEVASLDPNIEKINALLADTENYQFNCENASGENLLYRAVKDEELELVKFLLQHPQFNLKHTDIELINESYYIGFDFHRRRTETKSQKISKLLDEVIKIQRAEIKEKLETNSEKIIEEIVEEKSEFNSMSGSIASNLLQEDNPLILSSSQPLNLAEQEDLIEPITILSQEVLSPQILTPNTVIAFMQAKEKLDKEYDEADKISLQLQQKYQQSPQSQQLTNWLDQNLITSTKTTNNKLTFIQTTQDKLNQEDGKDLFDLTKIDRKLILANLDIITSSLPMISDPNANYLKEFFSEEELKELEMIASQPLKEQAVESLIKSKKDQRASFLKEQSTLLLREFCDALAQALPRSAKNKSLFISYAWTQEEIVDFVRNHLEKDLHEAGFKVTLDTRDLSVGANIIEFEGKISQTDFIVMVADPSYKERSDKLLGGVGDEAKFLEKRLRDEIEKVQIQTQSQEQSQEQSQLQSQGQSQEQSQFQFQTQLQPQPLIKQQCFLNILLRSGNAETSIPEYIHQAIAQNQSHTAKMIKTYDASRKQDDELTLELQQQLDQTIKKDIIAKMRKTESIFESRYAESLINLLGELYQDHISKQQFEELKYGYYHSINQLLEKTPLEIDALQQQEKASKEQRQQRQQLTLEQYLIDLIKDNQRSSEIVRIIRLQGSDINFNYQDDKGNSMLHYCAQNGNEKVFLEILKQQNIDPHLKNKFNESPQDIAKKSDQIHLVNLYNPDEIYKVVKSNQINKIKALINSFKSDLNNLLLIAVKKGYTEAVLILIKAGGDVNHLTSDNGNSLLSIACINGHGETALALIDNNADVNLQSNENSFQNNGTTELIHACSNKLSIVALKLIALGADINQADRRTNKTPLSIACEIGLEEVALVLIDKNADLNKAGILGIYEGRTPLSYACEKGYLKIVNALLAKNAEIDTPAIGTQWGATPLFYACENGHLDVLMALINYGADINQGLNSGDLQGQTPLSIACQKGHYDIALALIEAGAKINQEITGRNYAGRTPLSFACEKGHLNIVRLLIAKDAQINKTQTGKYNIGKTPLLHACEKGHKDIALELIANGANIDQISTGGCNDCHESPLIFACLGGSEYNLSQFPEGYEDIALELIAKGARTDPATYGNTNHGGKTALSIACQKGLYRVVLALIAVKADINHQETGEYNAGMTPLANACKYGHKDIVLALIEAGADLNKARNGKTPLMLACEEGHSDIALALIEAGADLNSKITENFNKGKTALSFALKKGLIDVVKALIDGGADISKIKKNQLDELLSQTRESAQESTQIEEISKEKPVFAEDNNEKGGDQEESLEMQLIKAVKAKNLIRLKALIAKGVDINHADKEGKTAFFIACQNGCTEIAFTLIANGAYLDNAIKEGSNKGQTPLSFACKNGHTQIVLALIAKGVNLNKIAEENDKGKTPLSFACENGHEKIALALIASGANLNLETTDKETGGLTPLIFASKRGLTSVVIALIAKGTNINQQGKGTLNEGQNALSSACENGHVDIVNVLLANGADINLAIKSDTGKNMQGGDKGRTPLSFACEEGHEEVVSALIAYKADLNLAGEGSGDNNGRTPLSFACEKGHEEVVSALISSGADLDKAGIGWKSNGLTPLSYACQNDRTKIAIALILAGADVNKESLMEYEKGFTPLSYACKRGYNEIALALIENNADVNIEAKDKYNRGQTALSYACSMGMLDVVRAMIKSKVNVNQVSIGKENKDLTPLLCACKKNYTEIALLLISNGADTSVLKKDQLDKLMAKRKQYGYDDKDDLQSIIDRASIKTDQLLFACAQGQTEIALELIAKGADVNLADKKGRTPLSFACEKGLTKVALELIAKGADVNLADNEDKKPLYFALVNDHTSTSLALFENGVDVNQLVYKGRTPLFYICSKGHTEVALALIAKGADVNLADKEDKKPLYYALAYDHSAIALALIENGVDINQLDYKGRTPLSYICSKDCSEGQTEIALKLIAKGADVNLADKKGRTPLSFACEEGHEAIALALIFKGANTKSISQKQLDKLMAKRKQYGYDDKDDLQPVVKIISQEIVQEIDIEQEEKDLELPQTQIQNDLQQEIVQEIVQETDIEQEEKDLELPQTQIQNDLQQEIVQEIVQETDIEQKEKDLELPQPQIQNDLHSQGETGGQEVEKIEDKPSSSVNLPRDNKVKINCCFPQTKKCNLM